MALLADVFGDGAVRGKGLLVGGATRRADRSQVVDGLSRAASWSTMPPPTSCGSSLPSCITEEQVERGVGRRSGAWGGGRS